MHVDDLAAAEGDHLEAFLAAAVTAEPRGRADDFVVADPGEVGLHLDSVCSALFDLELQDLTGLSWTASGGSAFPPEVTVGEAAPLCVFGKQRRERFWIALIQRLGGGLKLLDHEGSMSLPRDRRRLAEVPAF